jgi:hypothetical protein
MVGFLAAEQESVRNIHERLYNVYGSATVDRTNAGCWTKVMACETGKVRLHDLSHSGHLSH